MESACVAEVMIAVFKAGSLSHVNDDLDELLEQLGAADELQPLRRGIGTRARNVPLLFDALLGL